MSYSDLKTILVEFVNEEKAGAEGVAILSLNRPDKYNALSPQLLLELSTSLKQLANDSRCQVLIITGKGKAFTAGVDLTAFAQVFQSGESFPDELIPSKVMAAFPKPIIAAVNGYAITGGFELALACDFMIASSKAKFADTHIRAGVMPTWGLSQRLPRLIGIGRAKEMSFTGNFIDANQAERWGLVNRVVQPDQLISTCLQLAADIANSSTELVQYYKKTINDGYAGTFSDGMKQELERGERQQRSTMLKMSDASERRKLKERNKQQARSRL